MTAFEARLASAFLLALLGGLHCAAMCGGFVTALHTSKLAQVPTIPFALAYNAGRILSYSAAGAVVGLLGTGLYESDVLPVQIGLLLLAAAVLLGIAFSMLSGSPLLRRLEPLGAPVWRVLQPVARRAFAPRGARGALLAGLVWGWIPCAMVYAALPLALVAGSVAKGAAVMLAFGLGTVPNMAALELTASRIRLAAVRRQRWLRPAIGVALMLFALSDLAHAARIAGWQSPAVGWLASVCHA